MSVVDEVDDAVRVEQQHKQQTKSILEEIPYLKFINSIRETSRRTYQSILLMFMKDYQLTSTFYLLPPKLTMQKIEAMIIDHILTLRKDNISPSHISTSISVLKLFYTMNDVTGINFTKISKYKDEFRRKNKLLAYTNEQIKKILTYCDLRLRVVMLIFIIFELHYHLKPLGVYCLCCYC